MTIVEMRQNMKLKELIHSAIKEGGCGIIITLDRHLEHELMPVLATSGKKDVYHHKPTQPRMPPISIGGGIGEQRGEKKRILFTLN